MTITIELTPEQESKLKAVADARGTDPQAVLLDLVATLPDDESATHTTALPTADSAVRRKTTAEILAGWDAEGLPSAYGRDPDDASVIARRLRKQAENRELLK